MDELDQLLLDLRGTKRLSAVTISVQPPSATEGSFPIIQDHDPSPDRATLVESSRTSSGRRVSHAASRRRASGNMTQLTLAQASISPKRSLKFTEELDDEDNIAPLQASLEQSAYKAESQRIGQTTVHPSGRRAFSLSGASNSENVGLSSSISYSDLNATTNSGNSPVPPRPNRICTMCDQPIIRGGTLFRGKYYHAEHFLCSEWSCRRNLRGVLTFDKDDQLYCEKCYHANFSPKCAFCSEPIKDNTLVEALGMTFHRAHFFCSQCGRTFGTQDKFLEVDGKAYCEEDYTMLFAKRCDGCKKPILENQISVLERFWHDHCFVCSTPSCNLLLTAEGFYDYNNNPYCERHYYEQEANICDTCKKPIIGRCVVAIGRKFHPKHFNCSFCQKELDSTMEGYKEKKDKPYCTSCYIKLFC